MIENAIEEKYCAGPLIQDHRNGGSRSRLPYYIEFPPACVRCTYAARPRLLTGNRFGQEDFFCLANRFNRFATPIVYAPVLTVDKIGLCDDSARRTQRS